MTIEYLKCRADLNFEIDFRVNGAIDVSYLGHKKRNAETLKTNVCQMATLAKLQPGELLFIHEI